MSEPCEDCKHEDTDVCCDCPQSDYDGSCTCHCGNPPCGWCENSLWEEIDNNNLIQEKDKDMEKVFTVQIVSRDKDNKIIDKVTDQSQEIVGLDEQDIRDQMNRKWHVEIARVQGLNRFLTRKAHFLFDLMGNVDAVSN